MNEFETAVVNEPSVFEPLKFYCTFFYLDKRIRRAHRTMQETPGFFGFFFFFFFFFFGVTNSLLRGTPNFLTKFLVDVSVRKNFCSCE